MGCSAAYIKGTIDHSIFERNMGDDQKTLHRSGYSGDSDDHRRVEGGDAIILHKTFWSVMPLIW